MSLPHSLQSKSEVASQVKVLLNDFDKELHLSWKEIAKRTRVAATTISKCSTGSEDGGKQLLGALEILWELVCLKKAIESKSEKDKYLVLMDKFSPSVDLKSAKKVSYPKKLNSETLDGADELLE